MIETLFLLAIIYLILSKSGKPIVYERPEPIGKAPTKRPDIKEYL